MAYYTNMGFSGVCYLRRCKNKPF